ncbi:hypothetical protein SPRG_14211 [Saprolegnia parasitica CBS 223.65]|uniref:PX domain-containing protein n=1 Tax=Saprolegnia parasitica (strain CBS 223.65) TaxID=695850 RepID=A0A067BP79_SAPPC|nr:hypothetical protein SPRG_14211 [Saprolegnia parasitica CBS 223.65]KDO20063.1 hypothetical protein SPRG_14211 [Saprolegnia parasitica CBS 223.65]|eukprot:XP_012209224.1 hypothetical protein SPRG_14211 [Saprolegnia parasitica CBS 223.65]
MAAAPRSSPSTSTLRVRIIGHERNVDPLTKSPIVLYRAVVKYNGQTFERALRFSRFYNFHINLKPDEQRAVGAKFPPRHPFRTDLTDKLILKREHMLAAYMAGVSALPLTTHMEAALLRLLEIRKSQTTGSAPMSETMSMGSAYEPVHRIFTNVNRLDHGSFCSSRSSLQLSLSDAQSSSASWQQRPSASYSDMGSLTHAASELGSSDDTSLLPPLIPLSVATSIDEGVVDEEDDDDDSLFEEAISEPNASEIGQAAVRQREKVQSMLLPAAPLAVPNEEDGDDEETESTHTMDVSLYPDAIQQQLCVVQSILRTNQAAR